MVCLTGFVDKWLTTLCAMRLLSVASVKMFSRVIVTVSANLLDNFQKRRGYQNNHCVLESGHIVKCSTATPLATFLCCGVLHEVRTSKSTISRSQSIAVRTLQRLLFRRPQIAVVCIFPSVGVTNLPRGPSSVAVYVATWRAGPEHELEFQEGCVFRRCSANTTLDGSRFQSSEFDELVDVLAGIWLASRWLR